MGLAESNQSKAASWGPSHKSRSTPHFPEGRSYQSRPRQAATLPARPDAGRPPAAARVLHDSGRPLGGAQTRRDASDRRTQRRSASADSVRGAGDGGGDDDDASPPRRSRQRPAAMYLSDERAERLVRREGRPRGRRRAAGVHVSRATLTPPQRPKEQDAAGQELLKGDPYVLLHYGDGSNRQVAAWRSTSDGGEGGAGCTQLAQVVIRMDQVCTTALDDSVESVEVRRNVWFHANAAKSPASASEAVRWPDVTNKVSSVYMRPEMHIGAVSCRREGHASGEEVVAPPPSSGGELHRATRHFSVCDGASLSKAPRRKEGQASEGVAPSSGSDLHRAARHLSLCDDTTRSKAPRRRKRSVLVQKDKEMLALVPYSPTGPGSRTVDGSSAEERSEGVGVSPFNAGETRGYSSHGLADAVAEEDASRSRTEVNFDLRSGVGTGRCYACEDREREMPGSSARPDLASPESPYLRQEPADKAPSCDSVDGDAGGVGPMSETVCSPPSDGLRRESLAREVLQDSPGEEPGSRVYREALRILEEKYWKDDSQHPSSKWTSLPRERGAKGPCADGRATVDTMRGFRHRIKSLDLGNFVQLRLPLGNQPRLVDVLRAAEENATAARTAQECDGDVCATEEKEVESLGPTLHPQSPTGILQEANLTKKEAPKPCRARHVRKRSQGRLQRPSLHAIAWDTPLPTTADCSYTCHEQCQDLVTLDCKTDLTPDSHTSQEDLCIGSTVKLELEDSGTHEEEEEEEEEEGSHEEQEEKHEEEQQEKELKDEPWKKYEEVSTLRKTVNRLQSHLVDNETLEAWVERYNATAQGLQISKESDGSFRGCIRVHLNLSRPINIVAGTRPPSIYDILQEDRTMEKTLTSFYMPRDAVKAIHVTSKTTTREVIVALLRKFKVVDNPQKFALYERTYDTAQSVKAKLRLLGDLECPLVLALNWSADGLTNKRLVLQENDTADIQWEAFSLPELSNFLRILDKEEEEYRCQIQDKYALLRRRIGNILIQNQQGSKD